MIQFFLIKNIYIYAILDEGGYIGDLIIKFPVDKKYEGRETVGKQFLENNMIIKHKCQCAMPQDGCRV